ncbi:MAG: hypothetical protein ACJ8F7_02160 [Gemmataceae bacterium]
MRPRVSVAIFLENFKLTHYQIAARRAVAATWPVGEGKPQMPLPFPKKLEIDKLLQYLVKNGGSDLRLLADQPPIMRVRGEWITLDIYPHSQSDIDDLIQPLLLGNLTQVLATTGQVRFIHAIGLAQFQLLVSNWSGERTFDAHLLANE